MFTNKGGILGRSRNNIKIFAHCVVLKGLIKSKGPWFLQIKSDECEIDLSESEIAKMKKYSFNKLVKDKVNQIAAKYLIGLKERHSKSEYLKYSTSMQPYLQNENLSIQGKKLMFKIKNRYENENNEFKTNIPDDIKLQEHPEKSEQLLDDHHHTHQGGQQVRDT